MFLLSFYRILKFSLQDISRNIWLSAVTVIILVLALFSINMLLVVKVIGSATVKAIKQKIDISLYLKTDAPESEILALKADISNLNNVKEVRYISKEEAQEIFKNNNKNNPESLESLRALGRNPFAPTLVISPKNTDAIEPLIYDFNKINSDIIDRRDFTDYKYLLDKINAITDKVTKAGLFLAGIFIFITLMVIFNSVRVAIYTHNMEISIMRLVGASNSFVYLPFLVSGLIYALLGVGCIIMFFYPFLSLLQPFFETFFEGYSVNIIDYFNNHFWEIFGLQFLGIAAINVFASWWAVRRYAQV